MEQKQKIDFIIVGAMKSGTTSLGFYLRRHPNVCIPKGEVHFFDNERNFKKGLGWYERKLFRKGTRHTVVTGEKTTAYTYKPEVAERIYKAYPEVKLIWILREPVSRAYSNYIHAYRNGAVRFSFEEAIRAEPELIKKSIYLGYLKRSRYAEQVERFLKFFSREQMHFMLFESFVSDTRAELGKLFRFLGVSEEAFTFTDEPRGRTVMPRLQASIWAARKIGGTGPLWSAMMFANSVFKKPGYPKPDPELRDRLKDELQEDNRKLAEITGLDISVWK
jgi:hypothetical protein